MSTFGEYLFGLLRDALRAGENSELRRWADVLGLALDELKASLFLVRRAQVLATATGEALDAHGRDRGLARYPGESDDLYRMRLLAAHSIYAGAGTVPGIVAALELLGYPGAEVYELFRDGPVAPLFNGQHLYSGSVQHSGGVRWAEFKIRAGIGDRPLTAQDLAIVVDAIRRLKPAHTRLVAFALDSRLPDEYFRLDETLALTAALLWGDGVAGPAYHDGFARDGTYRYAGGCLSEAARFESALRLQDPLPGQRFYQAASRHDGGGARWRHVGTRLRAGWVRYGGTSIHNGTVSRRETVAHYGDRVLLHGGTRPYNYGSRHDGSKTHGANGLDDGLRLVFKHRGRVILDEVA